MKLYKGSCLCGDIRIEARGLPKRVGICHCDDCRKHHGAMFHASAIFSDDAVTVMGKPNHYQHRYFCPKCGSSVFSRSEGEFEIHLGILESAQDLVPSYELWTVRRADWLPPFRGMMPYDRDREE